MDIGVNTCQGVTGEYRAITVDTGPTASTPEPSLVYVIGELEGMVRAMEDEYFKWRNISRSEECATPPMSNPVKQSIEDVMKLRDRISDFALTIRREVYRPILGE